jgi:hypothetical protein
MKSGFYIRRLETTGTNRLTASISFKKGANLVTGASDTGKSYVFSALAYGLGDSEPPKDISESLGYTQINVEICTYADSICYFLTRIIGTQKIEVRELSRNGTQVPNTIKRYVTKGTGSDSISSFLLSLCNLNDKRVLKNKLTGVTQNFSWKSLLKLTFVDEISIIKLTSPFYFSEQFFDKVLAQSMLSVLLTGKDYSDVVEKEDKKIRETRINGKLEFLSYQIAELAQDKDYLIDEAGRIADSGNSQRFLTLDNQLKIHLEEIKQLERSKNRIVIERQNVYERLSYNSELLNRFNILEKQYLIDGERLEFILEAKILSDQLGDAICPICASPLGLDSVSHIKEHKDFTAAAIEELKKNESKLIGLRDSIVSLESEVMGHRRSFEQLSKDLEEISTLISENLSPKVEQLKGDLGDFLQLERVLGRMSYVDSQIGKLHKEKDRLEKLLNNSEEKENIDLLSYTVLRELSDSIQARLKAWNYEQYLQVDFNSAYQVFDIVINGKSRKSYGKGKRGLSYTACLLGLLDRVSLSQTGFSNLLVMDSPMTTFEEKKHKTMRDNDQVQYEVLKAFFEDLANLPEDSQVIIFDNKEPNVATSEAIGGALFIQEFTGNDANGRYGFFPM